MQPVKARSFNSLVEQYLGTRLPGWLADGVALPELSHEARQFILRMLTLMKRASYPVTDVNSFLVRALSTFVPEALPSACKGRIPPITLPGRHRKLDDYVAHHARTSGSGRLVFVDLGCGFPPVTTAETAQYFPDWAIFGVDRTFSTYVLFDPDGHYACFNRDGEFQYFQTQMTAGGRALNNDPAAARVKFKALFAELRPLMGGVDEQTSTSIEKDGKRLIHNHIRDYEAENLTFVKAEIQGLELPKAHAIRCMNVLLYFLPSVREKMRSFIGEMLCDDGIFLAGFNHTLGGSARYTVYHKAAGAITSGEFAFSLDNLRPIGVAPWYTIHEDDPDAVLLADLTGTIRNATYFWPDFNKRVDDLLDRYAVCRRGRDGYLHFPEVSLPPEKLIDKLVAMWRQLLSEGFAAGAVETLNRAGFKAWVNSVGDIAVKPFGGASPGVGTGKTLSELG